MQRRIAFVAAAFLAIVALLATGGVAPAKQQQQVIATAATTAAPQPIGMLGPSPTHMEALAPIKLWMEVELWNGTIAWNNAVAANAAREAAAQQRAAQHRHRYASTTTTSTVHHHYASSDVEACIFSRENGGSYGRGSNPSHFGAYQFDRQTWVANGGDPSTWGSASPTEQDQVFHNTVSSSGYSAWTPYDGC